MSNKRNCIIMSIITHAMLNTYVEDIKTYSENSNFKKFYKPSTNEVTYTKRLINQKNSYKNNRGR